MDTTAYCDDYTVYTRERDAQYETSRVAQYTARQWTPESRHAASVQQYRAYAMAAHALLQELADSLRESDAATVSGWLDALRPSIFDICDSYELERESHDDAVELWGAVISAARRVNVRMSLHSTLAEIAETARQVLKSLP